MNIAPLERPMILAVATDIHHAMSPDCYLDFIRDIFNPDPVHIPNYVLNKNRFRIKQTGIDPEIYMSLRAAEDIESPWSWQGNSHWNCTSSVLKLKAIRCIEMKMTDVNALANHIGLNCPVSESTPFMVSGRINRLTEEGELVRYFKREDGSVRYQIEVSEDFFFNDNLFADERIWSSLNEDKYRAPKST